MLSRSLPLLIAVLAALAVVAQVGTITSNGSASENEAFSDLQATPSTGARDIRAHRERRQLRRNPNIFGLFFQLIGETRRDIQKTFNDIARQVESGLVDENTIDNTTTTTTAATSEGDSTTSERPRVTRQELTRILGRNWRGLTRLFNQEVNIALNHSNINAAEARRAFWDSLSPFLEPATTTTRSNTTSRSG